MKRKLSFILVLTILAGSFMTACSSQSGAEISDPSEVQESNDKDTFVVGLEAGYAPFNWTQMDDSNGGEIGRASCRERV